VLGVLTMTEIMHGTYLAPAFEGLEEDIIVVLLENLVRRLKPFKFIFIETSG
jgi:hypothetical protein